MNCRSRVPTEPFVRWCERQLLLIANRGAIGTIPVALDGRINRETMRGARGVLAYRLGVDVRTLWTYLHRRDDAGRPLTTFSRYAVEDMLNRAGEDFYAVYPELEHERDVELEPDVWCPRCREMTTPLDGKCLWCRRRVVRPATTQKRSGHRVVQPANKNRKLKALRALLDEPSPPPPARASGRVVWRRTDTDRAKERWGEDDLAA